MQSGLPTVFGGVELKVYCRTLSFLENCVSMELVCARWEERILPLFKEGRLIQGVRRVPPYDGWGRHPSLAAPTGLSGIDIG